MVEVNKSVIGMRTNELDRVAGWAICVLDVKVNIYFDFDCHTIMFACMRIARGEYEVRCSIFDESQCWASYRLLRALEEDNYLEITDVLWEKEKVYNLEGFLVEEFETPAIINIRLKGA